MQVLHLGSQNPETAYTILCQDNTVDLAVVTEEKDLGIKFDCKLIFSKHISEICSKGEQRIGLIKRNFRFIDKKPFLILYKSLVRPLLEYCNTVWYPTFKKDSRAIESVQRKATKLVKYMKNWSYPERLLELGLPTMIYRRRRTDLLQIFRIISGTDKVHSNKIFQLAGDTATGGHSLKIHVYKLTANARVKANTLGVRVVNDRNALPESVVKSESINIFKSRLEDVWGDKVWKYDPILLLNSYIRKIINN